MGCLRHHAWDECTELCRHGQQKRLLRCLGGVPGEAGCCLGDDCDYKPCSNTVGDTRCFRTPVLIGLDGMNGQVVRLPVVLVNDENKELATVAIAKKVTVAMALTILPNPA